MRRASAFAVLTGEIVVTRRAADAASRLGDAVVESFEALNEGFDGAFALPIEVGEDASWRMVTARPRVALRAALYFRAELRARLGVSGIDTRVAIGAGGLDVVPAQSVSQGTGPAYRRSERALEVMPRVRRLALRVEDQPLSPGFDEMLGLIDHVAGRWTDKQALAVAGALRGWTQERIAGSWDRVADTAVSQQTVAQHLRRAGWHAVEPAIDFLDGLLA